MLFFAVIDAAVKGEMEAVFKWAMEAIYIILF